MDNGVFERLTEAELMTLCLFGEARGERLEGKIAVASVITNRLKRGGWFGGSIKEVVLKPKQFSCFNPSDPNRHLLEQMAKNFKEYLCEYEALRECFWVAVGFLDGWLKSNVGGATHYHNLTVLPDWTDSMRLVCQIGRHRFYEPVQ